MNIKQVLFTGFGIIISIVGISTVISNVTGNYLKDREKLVVHTYEVQLALESIEKRLVDAETGQRGFIFVGNESFLEPYNTTVEKIDEDFSSLEKLISDNRAQVERLNKLQTLSKEKLAELQETIALKKAGKNKELFNLVSSGKGKQIMDSIRINMDEMKNEENKLLEKRTKEADNTRFIVLLVTWGSFIVVVVISGITLIWINKIVIKPINNIANTIDSSSSEIASTVEQQERTASQQAAAVNETTTTMDELGVSSRQSSEQAEAAVQAAKRALDLTEGGNQAVENTLGTMSDLNGKVNDISKQILLLSEQTNQIGSISQLVSDIANQTNMLALNAAVEAVRAGDYGKGFAVVAAEIRKLADQSKQSANKINILVNDVQKSINSTVFVTNEGTKTVKQGMEIVQSTAQAFAGVSDAVNDVVRNNYQISLNIQQQTSAVEQVVTAMNNINQGARETASGISQTRLGTTKLNEATQKLKQIV
jgi:methyl-accepting chemotaxis protein